MPSLTECLETDHRRLDAILIQCKSLASAGGFAAAADRFVTFADGLSRHIDAEEDVLFPALQEHAPHAMGPVHVMRSEHAQLRELLVLIAAALRASDAAWQPRVQALEDILKAHNLKEERVLYPMADEAAGEAPDAGELQARLTGVLEGRVHPR
jgi:iron-sulfur cluster repair protein YtfE (RIC family)